MIRTLSEVVAGLGVAGRRVVSALASGEDLPPVWRLQEALAKLQAAGLVARVDGADLARGWAVPGVPWVLTDQGRDVAVHLERRWYVDPTRGDDRTGDGMKHRPLRTFAELRRRWLPLVHRADQPIVLVRR